MNDPIESVDAIRCLLPNGGQRFNLRQATAAMQKSYLTDQVQAPEGEEPETDSVVVVARKYGDKKEQHIEIGFFRAFGWFDQLEVSLRYRVTLRSLFLKEHMEMCGSQVDADQFFSAFRSKGWFRRYATVPAEGCTIKLRGVEEMAPMYAEILPRLQEKLGPFSCARSPEAGDDREVV